MYPDSDLISASIEGALNFFEMTKGYDQKVDCLLNLKDPKKFIAFKDA